MKWMASNMLLRNLCLPYLFIQTEDDETDILQQVLQGIYPKPVAAASNIKRSVSILKHNFEAAAAEKTSEFAAFATASVDEISLGPPLVGSLAESKVSACGGRQDWTESLVDPATSSPGKQLFIIFKKKNKTSHLTENCGQRRAYREVTLPIT